MNLRARGSTDQLNGSTRVGLPWFSLLAFLRLVTNPRVLRGGPSRWLMHGVKARVARPREIAWVPQPTERHADQLG